MEFEAGELFTQAARQVVPIARAKGLVCLAECDGPAVAVRGAGTDLRQGLHAMFCAAIDVLDSGFLFFAAEVSAPTLGRCAIAIHAAGTGVPAADAAVDRALAALELREERPPPAKPGERAVRRAAHGRCGSTGADITYLSVPPDGEVFTMRLSLPVGGAQCEAPDATVDGAPAWVLCEDEHWSQLLARQLQQLGWMVTAHRTAEAARRRLAAAHPHARRPALLLAMQSGTLGLAELQPLAAALPLAQAVLGWSAGVSGPHLSSAEAARIEQRPFPFSPADLRRMTLRAAGLHIDESASGLTQPAPLALQDRRRVLVVDDNPVNQLVASGMLQSLGFEVDAAADGAEAIARCRAHAPDAVLMDVQMPGMDGLEATRELRRLQRRGELRAFPIIAATAGDTGDGQSRRRCLEAGMDAYLGKPLSLTLLEHEVRRMLPLPPDEAA